jgi:hypothetical protein
MKRRDFIQHAAALPVALQALIDMDLSGGSTPVSSASMWIYLWDIVDEGYDAVFSRLKENGLTSISLASAYHAGRFLALHNPKRKVVFLEDGTVYFSPKSSLYGRIKPRVNSLVKTGHDLARVRREAEQAGLKTNAWVVSCHNTPLGTEYPDAACENAFGDTMSHNLCPSNPDVRSYLKAVVMDIASHGVGRIELEALQFQSFTHGVHHEREGIPLSLAMKALLGFCFCPSCRRRAAEQRIDFGALWKFTRQTLEAHFADPISGAAQYQSVDDLPHDLFKPFFEWRTQVTASLAEELTESVRGTNVVLRPLVSIDPVARTIVGIDVTATAKATGGILTPGYVKDGEALRGPLGDMIHAVDRNELIIGFQVGLPESGGKTEFLDRLSVARELGVRSFNFYNYGFIPYSHLTWIKNGIR